MKKIQLLTVCFWFTITGICAQDNERGLKEAYKDYFMIGVAVNQRNIADTEQANLVKREFNSMTAENDMKPRRDDGPGSGPTA